MRRVIAIVALAAGCHAVLDESPDGGTSIGDPDGSVARDVSSVASDAASDSGSACYNGRVVYLEFEGVTLTQGPSDATTNKAVWLGVTSAAVPKFHASDSNRAAEIVTITTAVKSALSSFPVTVVTQRPAAGPYVMIVFGGDQTIVDVPYGYAVNRLDCGDVVKSDVGWVSDTPPTSQKVADYAVGAIGYGLGLGATSDVNDCMCGWGNTCQQGAGPCTLSSSITAQIVCPNQTNPQDENAAFDKAFCQ